MRYILTIIFINSISVDELDLREPHLSLTDFSPATEYSPTQVDIPIQAAIRTQKNEEKLRKILEGNGIDINLADYLRRTSTPSNIYHPDYLEQQIHRYDTSPFTGITLSNIEKIMASMQEQQIDTANIQDDRLKEFITLSQALKVKYISYFDQSRQTRNVKDISDKNQEKILQHINEVLSLLDKDNLTTEVRSEVISNLLSTLIGVNLPQNIPIDRDSFIQGLPYAHIVSVLDRKYEDLSGLEQDSLWIFKLQLIHNMNNFERFIMYISKNSDISDELSKAIYEHLDIRSGLDKKKSGVINKPEVKEKIKIIKKHYPELDQKLSIKYSGYNYLKQIVKAKL